MAQFDTLHELMAADVETLSEIEGVGPKIAEAVVAYFALEPNRALVQAYADLGVDLTMPRRPRRRRPRHAALLRKDVRDYRNLA